MELFESAYPNLFAQMVNTLDATQAEQLKALITVQEYVSHCENDTKPDERQRTADVKRFMFYQGGSFYL